MRTVRIITWEEDVDEDERSIKVIKDIAEFDAGCAMLASGNYPNHLQKVINKAVFDCHFNGNNITIEAIADRISGKKGVRWHEKEDRLYD